MLFDPVARRTHWLNSTATFIWDRLDQPDDRIVDEIRSAFGIDADRAEEANRAVQIDLNVRQLLGDASVREPEPPPSAKPAGPRFQPVPPNT